MPDFTITVDPGYHMPAPTGPQRGPSKYEKYREDLQSLQPGDSFFLAADNMNKSNNLTAFARRIGVPLRRMFVQRDEIYQQQGVRFQRLSAEEVAARRPRKPRKPKGGSKPAAATTAGDSLDPTATAAAAKTGNFDL